jgi:hypothetical protein
VLVLHDQLLPRLIDNGLSNLVFACEVLVEETQIIGDHWLVRRIDLFFQEFFNIDSLEERMGQDFFDVTLCSKSLGLVFIKESLNDVLGDR